MLRWTSIDEKIAPFLEFGSTNPVVEEFRRTGGADSWNRPVYETQPHGPPGVRCGGTTCLLLLPATAAGGGGEEAEEEIGKMKRR